MPEHGRFPRENGSMICSDPVVQGSGGEVHDDRILNRHIAHRTDEGAFDPIIGKGERTTLVGFGHTIFGKHPRRDRKSTRLNSSHITISYAVFCLKKKKKK